MTWMPQNNNISKMAYPDNPEVASSYYFQIHAQDGQSKGGGNIHGSKTVSLTNSANGNTA
jgi:hypothetical protein